MKEKFVKCVDVEVLFGYLFEDMCENFMGVYVFVEVNIDENGNNVVWIKV